MKVFIDVDTSFPCSFYLTLKNKKQFAKHVVKQGCQTLSISDNNSSITKRNTNFFLAVLLLKI